MREDADILWRRLDRLACGKCGKHMDVSELEPFSTIECPACGTKQTVPAQLGSFLLVEQLGAGGMGAVYRAMDPTLGRFVAIKVMKAEMGEDPALVDSFLREARAAAALNHPNIVQIYSCGQEQGQPYIVMELVSGGRLDQMMANGKKVDEVRLLEIALDVAEGLKAANEAHLVHGDIKPANVLFDKSGRARIVDFGLAMFVNRQQEQGGVWGTPYYISPERARGGKADHRSDIYSLGATMFHALAGRPPFDGKTAADVVVARLKGPPPKLRELEPSIQPATAELIERMMAADPVLRYPTSASLLADMRHALVKAREARSPAGLAKRQKKKTDWGHLIVLGGAAVVLLVLAILVLRWFHRASKEVALPGKPPASAPAATAEVAAAEGDAGAEGVTIQQTEGGRPRLSVTFFTGELEQSVIRACAPLGGPDGARVFEDLEALTANVPANSARVMWLRVLQAPALWVKGENARADALLRQVATVSISQRKGHPVYMPQVLALYLIGDLNEERFARERRDWPVWYADLAAFFRGLKSLLAGEVEAAAQSFESYVKSEQTEPAWAFGLRPAAQRWLEGLEQWEAKQKELLALAGSGDVTGARAALDAYLQSAPAFMRAPADRILARFKQIEAQLSGARAAELERARRAIIQRDLDQLDAWVAERQPALVQQKDFRKLAQAVGEFANALETPEGKEQARIVREQFIRISELKTALGKELEANPFRQPDRELGGEAIGANALGVRIALPQRGVVTRPWEQVSPRLFVRLLNYISDNPALDSKTRAERLLTLAVLSAYYGAQDAALNFARLAREADASIEPTLLRFFPASPSAAEAGP